MTAPLSPAERARLDDFEARPAAEEACVERVAKALSAARDAHTGSGFPCLCGWEAGFGRGWEDRFAYHRLMAEADAVIAAMRPASDAPRTGDGRL